MRGGRAVPVAAVVVALAVAATAAVVVVAGMNSACQTTAQNDKVYITLSLLSVFVPSARPRKGGSTPTHAHALRM